MQWLSTSVRDQLLPFAGMTRVCVLDDDGGCHFNKAGCLSHCVRHSGEVWCGVQTISAAEPVWQHSRLTWKKVRGLSCVRPPPDALVWTDVCKIKVWAKPVKLPAQMVATEEKMTSELGEEGKVGVWRRLLGSGRRRAPVKSNWDHKSVPVVRLCPFDLCCAMEHSAHKVYSELLF